MRKQRKKTSLKLFLIGVSLIMLLVFMIFGLAWAKTQNAEKKIAEIIPPAPAAGEVSSSTAEVKRLKPEKREVHAIYLTAYSAGNPKKIDDVIRRASSTEINAVVIDIKDYSGYLSYDSDLKTANDLGLEAVKIKDLKGVINKLHENNIYAIARIAVFQDPLLSVKKPEWGVLNKNTGGLWRDRKGLSWLDPANPAVWNYHIAIAEEAIALGFDEINLDYVRFPSDGQISLMQFPRWDGTNTKAEVIEQFFSYFYAHLKDEPAYLSVDLFGLTTTATNDLNIGQLIEKAAPYFDYICPMAYPSHYGSGYLGFKNPASYPYEVVFNSVKKGDERIRLLENNRASIRPWIQDFNLGAVYTPAMVKEQMQASYDAGGSGYLVWDPKNIYSWEAFK